MKSSIRSKRLERRDHRAKGDLRLGIVGTGRVHTAPKDGVSRTVSEEGQGGATGKGRMIRSTLTQQLREVIATRIERPGRCALYSIIMVITEQPEQEGKKAVNEAAREKSRRKRPRKRRRRVSKRHEEANSNGRAR